MPLKNKAKNLSSDVKNIISDYASNKVVDWVLKNKVDQGKQANFKWSDADKALLKSVLLDPDNAPSGLPVDDQKFKRFFQTIIDNGLNTDDVRLFERYKSRLPLRALGLAYELSDFKFSTQGIVSTKKIDAGFYMLEITISPKSYSSRLPINLVQSNTKEKSPTSFVLFAQAEKISKRLIKLNDDASLTLVAEAGWHPKDIKHFKLAKLTRNFFLSRIYKKLGKDFKFNNTVITNDQLEILWDQYDQIFIKQNELNYSDYHSAIVQQEKKSIPNPTEQMRNLIRSLIKR